MLCIASKNTIIYFFTMKLFYFDIFFWSYLNKHPLTVQEQGSKNLNKPNIILNSSDWIFLLALIFCVYFPW